MTPDIRIAPDVRLLLLEDEGVFFAEGRQEIHVFNTPATFVWCCLEEGYGPAEVVSAYATAFAVDPREAEGHVIRVLRQWEGLGYISGFAAPGGPETDLTMVLGWLLTNAALREEFARAPLDLAHRFNLRAADVDAFTSLDAAGLDAQARAVARAAPRRKPQFSEHALAAVSASGKSLLEVAAKARLASGRPPIARYYRLLTTRFRLCLDSTAQDAIVHLALAHLEIEAPGAVDVALDVLAADGGHLLCEDLLPIGHCGALDQLVPMVKSQVRQTAINRHRYFMAIHAGVVGHGGRCIVLPGAPGRGKTTLTAALSRAGFRYFSDEFALLEEGTLHVRPVPLGLTVKPGSVDPLAPYYPEIRQLPAHMREDAQIVRYVNPDPDPTWWTRSDPVGWIVFPVYSPNAVTALRPVNRPEALRRLLAECLVLPERLDRVGVENLVNWIRGVTCLELTMSSLADAIGLLKEVVSRA